MTMEENERVNLLAARPIVLAFRTRCTRRVAKQKVSRGFAGTYPLPNETLLRVTDSLRFLRGIWITYSTIFAVRATSWPLGFYRFYVVRFRHQAEITLTYRDSVEQLYLKFS